MLKLVKFQLPFIILGFLIFFLFPQTAKASTTCLISGKEITITTKVNYWSDVKALTHAVLEDKRVNLFDKTFNQLWGSNTKKTTSCGYNVKFVIDSAVVASGTSCSANAHCIYISDTNPNGGSGVGWVITTVMNPPQIPQSHTGWWKANWGAHVVNLSAHELGHLMGLDDEYLDAAVDANENPGDTIMGCATDTNTQITQQMLDTVVAFTCQGTNTICNSKSTDTMDCCTRENRTSLTYRVSNYRFCSQYDRYSSRQDDCNTGLGYKCPWREINSCKPETAPCPSGGTCSGEPTCLCQKDTRCGNGIIDDDPASATKPAYKEDCDINSTLPDKGCAIPDTTCNDFCKCEAKPAPPPTGGGGPGPGPMPGPGRGGGPIISFTRYTPSCISAPLMPDCICYGNCTLCDIITTALNAIRLLLELVGSLLLLMFVWGGFTLLTSAGKDDRVKKGKDIIGNAVKGLLIAFFAFIFISGLIFILTKPEFKWSEKLSCSTFCEGISWECKNGGADYICTACPTGTILDSGLDEAGECTLQTAYKLTQEKGATYYCSNCIGAVGCNDKHVCCCKAGAVNAKTGEVCGPNF